MIRSTKILFCDNDHGAGDVTFPATTDLDVRDFIETPSLKQLRAEAKKAGWSRERGRDICEGCTEGDY